jgi:hypothetical protein
MQRVKRIVQDIFIITLGNLARMMPYNHFQLCYDWYRTVILKIK